MDIRKVRFLIPCMTLVLSACPAPPDTPTGPQPDKLAPNGQVSAGDNTGDSATGAQLRHPEEVHLANIRQLTHGGSNGEAYWSFDDKQLIFQTTQPPYKCKQIVRMPSDGSGAPVLVSTGKGETTCSYFLPGNREVIYSSTTSSARSASRSPISVAVGRCTASTSSSPTPTAAICAS